MESERRIDCVHQTSLALVHVPCLLPHLPSNEQLVCEPCFRSGYGHWAKAEINRYTLDETLACGECERRPSRWREDNDSGMCDNCALHMFEMEQGFCSSFEPDSFAYIEEPDAIVPDQIFLGSLSSTANIIMLQALGITNILTCAAFVPLFHFREDSSDGSGGIRYLRLPLYDSLDEDILRYLPTACQFIDDCLARGEKVLIHCQAGVSRSASVCIAWLMLRRGLSYQQAYMAVKSRRSCVNPNDRFANDLSNHWAEDVERLTS